MSQVSRRPIKRETEEKIRALFWETIANCSSKSNVSLLLEDLLTPTENVMLSKRLAIAYLLLKGYPYEVIRSTLNVSTPTIGTVSLLLKIRGEGIRQALGRMMKQRQWQTFFTDIMDTAIEIFGKSKGNDWKKAERYKHHRQRKKHAILA